MDTSGELDNFTNTSVYPVNFEKRQIILNMRKTFYNFFGIRMAPLNFEKVGIILNARKFFRKFLVDVWRIYISIDISSCFGVYFIFQE